MQIGVEEKARRDSLAPGETRNTKERQRTRPLHIMEAAESLRALAAVLRKSDTVPNLVSMRVLEEFGLDEEHDALEQQMVAAIVEAKAIADGSAGDQKKYLKACETQRRRWALFVAMRQDAALCSPISRWCRGMRHSCIHSAKGRAFLGGPALETAVQRWPSTLWPRYICGLNNFHAIGRAMTC